MTYSISAVTNVIYYPISHGQYINIKGIFKKENETYEDYIYSGGSFPTWKKGKSGIKVSGFSGRYPNIWPFDGPKVVLGKSLTF